METNRTVSTRERRRKAAHRARRTLTLVPVVVSGAAPALAAVAAPQPQPPVEWSYKATGSSGGGYWTRGRHVRHLRKGEIGMKSSIKVAGVEYATDQQCQPNLDVKYEETVTNTGNLTLRRLKLEVDPSNNTVVNEVDTPSTWFKAPGQPRQSEPAKTHPYSNTKPGEGVTLSGFSVPIVPHETLTIGINTSLSTAPPAEQAGQPSSIQLGACQLNDYGTAEQSSGLAVDVLAKTFSTPNFGGHAYTYGNIENNLQYNQLASPPTAPGN